MPIAVFGHQSPDTDAVSSALVCAGLLERRGQQAKPYRLGPLNPETEFVFGWAKAPVPELLTRLEPDQPAFLVDHNEAAQSLPGLATQQVVGIVDHHRIGQLSTPAPILLRTEPVGCSATLLLALQREWEVALQGQEARLMLAAILSDTLGFRSPTTTEADRRAARQLAQLGEVEDLTALEEALFAAKSDVSGIPADALLKMDFKVYRFGGRPYGLAVLETTHPASLLARKGELLEAMREEKAKSQLAGIFLGVVDILSGTNQTLVPSPEEAQLLERLFGAPVHDHLADLGDRISRKQQIVPVFERHLS